MPKLFTYNVEYVCRYHRDDIFEPSDGAGENERSVVLNYLYQEDLCQAFGVDEDECSPQQVISRHIPDLLEQIRPCNELVQCARNLGQKFGNDSLEMGLCILISFPLFHYSHACICEFLTRGRVDDTIQSLLGACDEKIFNTII